MTPPKPLVQNTEIEVVTKVPAVQVTLTLVQAELIRDLLQSCPEDAVRDKAFELFKMIGGLSPLPRFCRFYIDKAPR